MILFDVQAVQSRAHGERGIARYALELAFAIERLAPGRIDAFVVNPNRAVPDTIEPLLRTGRVMRSDQLPPGRASLLHIASPIELDVPADELIVGQPQNLVVNLYDLIPLVFADHYLADPLIRSRYSARLGIYHAADWVLSDSQSAVDDAVDLLGVPRERCVVIGAGTSRKFCPPISKDAALDMAKDAVTGLRPGFVLLPSGIDWRKNIEGVIEAYAMLPGSVRAAHQLVLVCRIAPEARAMLQQLADELGCGDTLLMTGFVSDQVLIALNQAADLVVFPSRYEGFGLPVLEARRCGAPVICGDNSSLREVQPDPAGRFDSTDTRSIADTLRAALTDADVLQQLRDAPVPPFTWDRAARLTLEVYERALSRTHAGELMGDQRPRFAYVTPLPPIESGIASYSYHLLQALTRYARVRCFTDQSLLDCQVPEGVALSPLQDLNKMHAAGEFDHIVYALGNNMLHHAALDELKRTPGAVHLHDVRLSNCYAGARWPDVVEAQYPGRFTEAELQDLSGPGSVLGQRKQLFMLGEVARHATHVLTHSDHARSLAVLEFDGVDVSNVGPLACPQVSAAVGAGGPPCISSFGIVSPAKQSDKAVAASTKAAAAIEGCLVRIVGQAPPDFSADGVEVTGYVDDDDFMRHVAGTTVAVQLRDGSNGESSAAVAGCLAAGIPTIVTAIGSAVEYPDDAVVKVERDITVDELAEVVLELMRDPQRRARLSEAALAYAARNTYDDAARRLFAAVTCEAGVSRRSMSAAR